MGTVLVFDYIDGVVRQAGGSAADKREVERAIEQQREVVTTASGTTRRPSA